ncbi:MAG: DUF6383 domain-containing protein [Candidatus Azobacteroides sp.]|nr:DUF6383 domain-containing protein [Candidatus Azobacteroides sp.]
MKRLFTIFVSSIIGVSLWGQAKLPVTILGDVYIANTGQVTSEGTVHLQAISGNQVANVANYGTLTMDSAIFYSNDSVEGLLMNKKDSAIDPAVVNVPGKGVSVRKTFTKNNAWYQVSLPFNVNLNGGVVNPITGKTMHYYANDYSNSDFYIQFYDTEKRAKVGMNVDSIWQMLPITETQMKKGTGYRIAIKMVKLIPGTFAVGSNTLETDTIGGGAGRFSVDFFAADAANISDLFAMKSKGVDLKFFPANFYIAPENSEGWNAIGGLNSTNYLLSGSTVNFTDPIYAWTDLTQWGYPLNPEDYTEPDGTLRPYAVFFVQKADATNLTYDGSNSGGFSFKGDDGNGLELKADPALPVFRSVASSSYDMFKVQLTGVKNNFTSRVYFKFNDAFTQTFNTSEGDRVLLQATMPTLHSIWAMAQNANNISDTTFINCLPYSASEVPLGVNIPTAGDYVFSLKNVAFDKGIASVILKNNVTGEETNLLNSDYSIHVDSSLKTGDQFVLFINKTPTSIDQATASDIYAYAENNVITVKNLNSGDKVQVLDLTGHIIASGIASGDMYSTPVNQKGVYIVSVKDGSKVLKVLNK